MAEHPARVRSFSRRRRGRTAARDRHSGGDTLTARAIAPRHGIRAVALDFDGVLVASSESKRRAYDDLFAGYPAHQVELTTLRDADPSTNRVMFFRRALAEVFGDPDNETLFRELMAGLSSAMVARVSACPECRGARALLDALAGTPLHVVSLTPQADLERILHARGWSQFFRSVYGSPPWSKPDALRSIVVREGLRYAEELFFVGDSATDLAAAREARVRFAMLGPRVGDSDVLLFDDPAMLNVWLHAPDEALTR